MLLGHVASKMGSKFNVVATVTGMLGQRLFHPTSPLDGKIVKELGKIVAHTGVWRHGCMEAWVYGIMGYVKLWYELFSLLLGPRDYGGSGETNEPITRGDVP